MARQRTATMRNMVSGPGGVEPSCSNALIAFAAKAGSAAEEGQGDHNPFTPALLNNLFAPGLDVRLTFCRVRDDVVKNTDNRQERFVYGSLVGGTLLT